MINELVLGVSAITLIFGVFTYYRDSKRIIRLLPLLEVKLANAKEDYFGNIHRVWERMEKKGDNR